MLNLFAAVAIPDKAVRFVCSIAVCAILLATIISTANGELPDVYGRSFRAEDSFRPESEIKQKTISSKETKVRKMLGELGWKAESFDVSCQRPLQWPYDCLVRFPSAGWRGTSESDAVALEWHMARNDTGEIIEAPGVIVVHESGRGMVVGRTFALLLSRSGLHTFMIQLPGYGVRKPTAENQQPSDTIELMQQSVRDVRRARDAVSVLPLVNGTHIGIQGTSLGGFVAATTAGLDGCFDSVFVMLAGGNIYEVIERGERDAASVRKKLAAQGFTGERLKTSLEKIEPIHLAHRLNARKTWLFSARRDKVVPLENAFAWANAVGLEPDHHIIIDADHYSGIVHIPTMVHKIRGTILSQVERLP